jgi:NAD(P)-dependent dehydrogenase (short-subunit alcohol dehydrogenase family)
MGQPEDLMGAVTYLSSDAAAYVTGKPLFQICELRVRSDFQ